jgi:streptogramin lyase
MKRGFAAVAAVLVAVSAVLLPARAAPSRAATIVDIPAMTLGPDGNVWFAGGRANNIGRVTPSGKVTLFKLPFLANPRGIAPGPGGAIYFSEYQDGNIGRITMAGKISQIVLSIKHVFTDYLVRAPNNTLWFADGNNIGELTASLKFVLHRLPFLIVAENLAETSSGNLWFTDFAPYSIKGSDHSVIIRMTPQGGITAFPISYGTSGIATGLAAGPDGNLWYTWTAKGLIGRVTTAGKNTIVKTSATVGAPQGVVSGPNRSLWLACAETTLVSKTTSVFPAAIESLTPQGSTRAFPVVSAGVGGTEISAITVRSDGNLWFPDATYVSGIVNGATIDRMTPGGKLTRFPIPGVATPNPAPTPTPTSAVKIPIAVTLAAQVQRGAVQSIDVQTAPNASITMQVEYPQSEGFTITSTANTQGAWQYSWQVNAPNAGTATVKLTVEVAGATRHYTKTFAIT